MCDNEAVVSVIRAGSCKEGHMAHMLRCSFFLEARFGFAVVAAHVPGSFNIRADALSRNYLDVFHSLAPQASSTPIQVPAAVVEGLAHTHTSISLSWTRLQFCVAGAIAPLPTSESILCRYVAFLAKDNLKHQTIKTYLSAVRHMHIVAGKGDPFKEDMPLLEYTMRD